MELAQPAYEMDFPRPSTIWFLGEVELWVELRWNDCRCSEGLPYM